MKSFLTRYHLIVPKHCLPAAILVGLIMFPKAQAQNGNQASNQVPNAEFRGNQISVLSENSVFPGSPGSNAVDISVVNGPGFTGFDHEPVQVPLTPAG
mgnify:CR=1 FL=1